MISFYTVTQTTNTNMEFARYTVAVREAMLHSSLVLKVINLTPKISGKLAFYCNSVINIVGRVRIM